MKSHIDFSITFQNEFVNANRFKKRFARYWGTETVDGVRVFKDKFQVYPGQSSTNVQNMLKILGIKKDINKANFDGLDSYWLYFNSSKMSDPYDGLIKSAIANKLNSYILDNKKYNFHLNIAIPDDPLKFKDYTKEQITDYVDKNYLTIFEKNYAQTSADTLVFENIGQYLLLDDGSNFYIDTIKATVMPVKHIVQKNFQYQRNHVYYTSSISIEVEVEKKAIITEDSVVVNAIIKEKDEERKRQVARLMESSKNYDMDDYNFQNDKPLVTNQFFYKNRLREEVLDIKLVKSRDFVELISKVLDTGYKKKKVKWYKKIISLVIAVVAVWLAVWSAGNSLVLLATYLGVASVALYGLTYLAQKNGMYGYSEYMGKYAKVVSLGSTILGIYAAIQSFITQMAKTVAEQGTKEVIKQTIVSAVTVETKTVASETAIQIAKETGQPLIEETVVRELSFKKISTIAIKVVKQILSIRNKGRLEDNKNEISSMQRYVDEQEEQLSDISDKEHHIGIEDIKSYTRQLDKDNMRYEIDYLYEKTRDNIGRPSFFKAYGLNLTNK